ncbi:glycosyltransferase [Dysgonomonas mossii]|uniref:Glycosyltransferase n=1 Tax=Dysgonomonas mossii TaxID=163665 RepID=A0A4Y9ISG7_9BACT|nr:glycosyltransferase [Dysgonomonas mossii]MBF0760362.1 glycosyltransferase [Dysgonomonas mossii]TFU91302.1 glycosyltransferase [Dysgonomonas mossii]
MGENINNPKVSIIIPVYNTESFVEEAILSILNQTLSETEVIVVDDGSTDSSLEIIKTLADTDSRIKVFSQRNQGQSVARNLGLSIAKGEYIYFMDSDDILKKDTLACCYKKCNEEQLDFVFFDALNFGSENISFPLNYDRKGKINDHLIYRGPEILNILLDIKEYRVPLWLYFIKTSFIKENELLLQAGLSHEDQIFSAQIFYLAEKVGYIPEIFFMRRIRANSVMTSLFSIRNITSYFKIVRYLLKFVENKPQSIQELNAKTIKYIFDPAVYASHTLNFKERMSVAETCMLEFSKYISFKSWLVLLFPSFLTIKSYFKKLHSGRK